ncbi:hypothetical protein INR49_000727, partial [Caranx melampygus]
MLHLFTCLQTDSPLSPVSGLAADVSRMEQQVNMAAVSSFVELLRRGLNRLIWFSDRHPVYPPPPTPVPSRPHDGSEVTFNSIVISGPWRQLGAARGKRLHQSKRTVMRGMHSGRREVWMVFGR